MKGKNDFDVLRFIADNSELHVIDIICKAYEQGYKKGQKDGQDAMAKHLELCKEEREHE